MVATVRYGVDLALEGDAFGHLTHGDWAIVRRIATGRIVRGGVHTLLRASRTVRGAFILSACVSVVTFAVVGAAVVDGGVYAGIVKARVGGAQIQVVAIRIEFTTHGYHVILAGVPGAAEVNRAEVVVVALRVLYTTAGNSLD
jgi:hypothetical protein